MKKMCLFAFAVLMCFHVFAQYEKGYVYLKNGTILKGKFQYSSDLNKLKVESAGNIWVFEASEIDSVSRHNAWRNEVTGERFASHRMFFNTSFGFLAGNSENSQSAPFSFTASLNYPVTSNISLGVGAGVEFLKESYLPAFLNTEYRLRNSASTPFLFVMAGYQVPIDHSRTLYYDVYPAWSSVWPAPNYTNEELDPKGGLLINPGIGYLQMFSPGFGMSLAFGYRYHRLHYKGENDYGLNIDYNRLSVKFGIIFN